MFNVSFLGPATTYTHQAALRVFDNGEGHGRIEIVPVKYAFVPEASIRDVFEAVQSGRSTFGMVPFENSTYGPVTAALEALADRKDEFGDVVVMGEVCMEIHHCLIGREGEKDWAHIRQIYSHQQALGQTKEFLRARFAKTVKQIAVESTAKGVEMAAADATGQSAAIAGRMAADAMLMPVLAADIEDRKDNRTRFFALRTRSTTTGLAIERNMVAPKSLVTFSVPNATPGALAAVLDCFRRADLNLTSINSVASLSQPFQYVFVVEFEHPTTRDAGADERVQQVLAEVAKVAESHRLLGTWNKP